jgi:hypothetical protein
MKIFFFTSQQIHRLRDCCQPRMCSSLNRDSQPCSWFSISLLMFTVYDAGILRPGHHISSGGDAKSVPHEAETLRYGKMTVGWSLVCETLGRCRLQIFDYNIHHRNVICLTTVTIVCVSDIYKFKWNQKKFQGCYAKYSSDSLSPASHCGGPGSSLRPVVFMAGKAVPGQVFS